MAELKSAGWWSKYVPDIGENRQLEKPFYLEVLGNMSNEEMDEHREQVLGFFRKAQSDPSVLFDDEGAAAAFEGLVRMGREPLVVRGKPVTTLAQYFAATRSSMGVYFTFNALADELLYRNSIKGTSELFSERLSGGRTTTRTRSEDQGAAPTNGNETSASDSSAGP